MVRSLPEVDGLAGIFCRGAGGSPVFWLLDRQESTAGPAAPCGVRRMPTFANYMTMAEGMLGLSGFTVTCSLVGEMTRSMSSMGMAPRRTRSPRTSAPP